MKTLILFSSKYGAAEKCAKLIAQGLTEEAMVQDLKSEQYEKLEAYDTILIGCGIYGGRMQGEVKKFIETHEELLANKNVGFFLCCKDRVKAVVEYMQTNLPKWIVERALIKEHLGHEINLERMNFLEKSLLKVLFKIKESHSEIDYEAIDRITKKINEMDVVNG